jgi:hypothetical protein
MFQVSWFIKFKGKSLYSKNEVYFQTTNDILRIILAHNFDAFNEVIESYARV